MAHLDWLYVDLLRRGMVALRDVIYSGNLEWVKVEVAFLHNVPSLIGEANVQRHRYFWNVERALCLEWASAARTDEVESHLRTFYQSILDELQPLIESL